MTAPGGGGADEIREQLADWTGAWTQAERDDLLDVVRALIAKCAAAELRAAAADWEALVRREKPPIRGSVWLNARAAALDGTP